MRALGLVNARGGSKGIPRKNVKPLLGKPLIAYSIEAGLRAARLSRVVVSTDDDEIAGVARQFGADVPFRRPDDLAADSSLQIHAIRHALTTLAATGDHYDVVVILQPTCPLRLPEDIDGALAVLEESSADTVISVTEVRGQHPLTMYERSSDGALTPLMEANRAGVLRQDFPQLWWRNGAIYATRVAIVLERNSLYGAEVMGFPMPAERSANIDDPLDWAMAETLLRLAGREGIA